MAYPAQLGETEHLLLLALLRVGDGAVAPDLLRELSARSGREVSRGSVYVTLDRLEEKGLISSRAGTPSPERGGHPPRLLTLTPAGLAVLREQRHRFLALWSGVEERLEGA